MSCGGNEGPSSSREPHQQSGQSPPDPPPPPPTGALELIDFRSDVKAVEVICPLLLYRKRHKLTWHALLELFLLMQTLTVSQKCSAFPTRWEDFKEKLMQYSAVSFMFAVVCKQCNETKFHSCTMSPPVTRQMV